jgi:hypothetical protein
LDLLFHRPICSDHAKEPKGAKERPDAEEQAPTQPAPFSPPPLHPYYSASLSSSSPYHNFTTPSTPPLPPTIFLDPAMEQLLTGTPSRTYHTSSTSPANCATNDINLDSVIHPAPPPPTHTPPIPTLPPLPTSAVPTATHTTTTTPASDPAPSLPTPTVSQAQQIPNKTPTEKARQKFSKYLDEYLKSIQTTITKRLSEDLTPEKFERRMACLRQNIPANLAECDEDKYFQDLTQPFAARASALVDEAEQAFASSLQRQASGVEKLFNKPPPPRSSAEAEKLIRKVKNDFEADLISLYQKHVSAMELSLGVGVAIQKVTERIASCQHELPQLCAELMVQIKNKAEEMQEQYTKEIQRATGFAQKVLAAQRSAYVMLQETVVANGVREQSNAAFFAISISASAQVVSIPYAIVAIATLKAISDMENEFKLPTAETPLKPTAVPAPPIRYTL